MIISYALYIINITVVNQQFNRPARKQKMKEHRITTKMCIFQIMLHTFSCYDLFLDLLFLTLLTPELFYIISMRTDLFSVHIDLYMYLKTLLIWSESQYTNRFAY